MIVFIQKFIKQNHSTLGSVVPLDKGLYDMANLPQKTSDKLLPAKIIAESPYDPENIALKA